MCVYIVHNDSLMMNCRNLEKKNLIEPWDTASENLAEISIYSPRLAPDLNGVIARINPDCWKLMLSAIKL